MIKTIYVSYPFSLKSQESLNKASTRLLKIFGTGYFAEQKLLGINPLFEIYGQAPLNDKQYYALAGFLMPAAETVLIIRAKGWEYCEIVQQEIAAAYRMDKPVIFADYIEDDAEQKLQ